MTESIEVALGALWNQLVKDLRSRLEALESHGIVRNPKVDEPFRNELIATVDDGFVSIWLHTEDGHGSWNMIAAIDQCEPWKMTIEGVATFRGLHLNVAELANEISLMLAGQKQ